MQADAFEDGSEMNMHKVSIVYGLK
jgi:hypothetical protein